MNKVHNDLSCEIINNLNEFLIYRHAINLCFDEEPLLKGRRIFQVQNYLHKCRQTKQKGLFVLFLFIYCLFGFLLTTMQMKGQTVRVCDTLIDALIPLVRVNENKNSNVGKLKMIAVMSKSVLQSCLQTSFLTSFQDLTDDMLKAT